MLEQLDGTGLADLFTFETVDKSTCEGCGQSYDNNKVPNTTLQVGFPDDRHPTSAQAMLEAALAPVELRDATAYACGVCQTNQAGSRQTVVTVPPQVLALHARRFEIKGWEENAERRWVAVSEKVKDRVAFGPNLTVPTSRADGADARAVAYALCAVVAHKGDTLAAGHFIAYVKGRDGHWYKQDDRSSTACTDADVFGPDAQREAYIWFYKVRRPRAASRARWGRCDIGQHASPSKHLSI